MQRVRPLKDPVICRYGDARGFALAHPNVDWASGHLAVHGKAVVRAVTLYWVVPISNAGWIEAQGLSPRAERFALLRFDWAICDNSLSDNPRRSEPAAFSDTARPSPTKDTDASTDPHLATCTEAAAPKRISAAASGIINALPKRKTHLMPKSSFKK